MNIYVLGLMAGLFTWGMTAMGAALVFFMKEQLKQRIGALSGSLIRVKVGGATEVEARNRRTIIEKMIQTIFSLRYYSERVVILLRFFQNFYPVKNN